MKPWASSSVIGDMNYRELSKCEIALLLEYAAKSGERADPKLLLAACHRLSEPLDLIRKNQYARILGDSDRIKAIKKYRAETGCSLREASEYIDKISTPPQGDLE